MDWLQIIVFVSAGFALGTGVASHIFDRREQRRQIERRLAEWGG